MNWRRQICFIYIAICDFVGAVLNIIIGMLTLLKSFIKTFVVGKKN